MSRLALTRLREEPICDLTRNPFDDEAFSFCRNLKLPEVPVVRAMTFFDLYGLDSRIRRILPQHRIGEAHRMVDSMSSRPLGPLYLPPRWMKADLTSSVLGKAWFRL